MTIKCNAGESQITIKRERNIIGKMGGASLATLYTARWGLCDTQTAVRSPVYTFDKLYTPYKIQGMIIQDKYYYRYIGGMLLNWI
jgi:hypothetical protein